MKLFEIQTGLTSFAYPVTKIIICLSVIILCIMRNRIFCFPCAWINIVISVMCFIVSIASILCLYISVAEIFYVTSNLSNSRYSLLDARSLQVEDVVEIVAENSIVEIEIQVGNKIIKAGTSSECNYSSSVFENKLFYISKTEYDTIDQFEKALIDLFPSQMIPVLKIDGIPPE